MSFEKLLCKEQYLEINIYLQQCTETIKAAYNQQRNKCVSILKKSKRSYFECLDVKFVKDFQKILEKNLSAFFK